MKKEDFKEYADSEGVSVEAYMHLFVRHDHDQEEKLFDGAAVVTMTDALKAIRIDRENRKKKKKHKHKKHLHAKEFGHTQLRPQ